MLTHTTNIVITHKLYITVHCLVSHKISLHDFLTHKNRHNKPHKSHENIKAHETYPIASITCTPSTHCSGITSNTLLYTATRPISQSIHLHRYTPRVLHFSAIHFQRWALILGAYDYTITYKPRCEQANVNSFHHLPLYFKLPLDDTPKHYVTVNTDKGLTVSLLGSPHHLLTYQGTLRRYFRVYSTTACTSTTSSLWVQLKSNTSRHCMKSCRDWDKPKFVQIAQNAFSYAQAYIIDQNWIYPT